MSSLTLLALALLSTAVWGILDNHGLIRNRTAILITGQIRSGNLSWTSGRIHENNGFRMFGDQDPPTPIKTQIEWILKPFSNLGGIDVFMFIESRPDSKDVVWNGQPETFLPVAGDPTPCKLYSDHALFNGTGNRFFCMVEDEFKLMNNFIRKFPMWDRRSLPYNNEKLNEQAIRQYYGMYRANTACKQFAIANGVHYSYKIRMRPDTAIVKPFPNITDINFLQSKPGVCDRHIYYANKRIYQSGNEDWFNIGLAADMDHLLDRYVDFTTDNFTGTNKHNYWDLEDHLTIMMKTKYHICMTDYYDIWMVVIRVKGHTLNTWQPPALSNDWQELSVFNESLVK